MSVDASLLAIGIDYSKVTEAIDKLRGLETQSGKNEAANKKLESSSGLLGKAASALGISLSAVEAALLAGTVAAINYLDKLDEMAEKTGVSATTLGGLGYAASQSDTNLETLTAGMGKLSDKMQAAAAGNKQAEATFASMGLSIYDATGALKAEDAMLLEIADKFASYKDGTEKSALAVDVFSKAGRELIPLLNKGGEGIRALSDEFIGMTGNIDNSAAQASDFNDKLAAMKSRSSAMFMHMAGEMLPALNTFIDSVFLSSSGTDTWKTVTEGATFVLKALLVVVIEGIAGFKQLGTLLGGVGAALMALAHGDLSGAGTIMKETFNDIKKIGSTAATDVEKVWTASSATVIKKAKEMGDQAAPPIAKLAKESKDFETAMKDAAAQVAKAQTDYENLGRSVSEKLTPSMEKLLEKMTDPKWETLSDVEKQAIIDTYALADALEHEIAVIQEGWKDWDAQIKQIEDASDKKQNYINKVVALKGAMEDQNEDLETELSLLGSTKLEHDLAAVKIDFERQKRELNNAAIEAYGRDLLPMELAALQAEFDKRVDLIIKIDAQTTAINNQRLAYDKLSSWLDDAGSSFFQAMGEGFQGLKDWVEDLGKVLKQTLLQTLYELTAKRWLISIAASATGINEASAQVAGAQSNNWLTGLLGGASGGMNLGGSSWLGGLSSFMTGGTEAFSAFGTNLGLMFSGAGESIGGFAGLMSSALPALTAALPIIGGIVGILALTGGFDGLFGGGGGPKKGGGYNQGIPGFNMYPGELTTEGNAQMAKVVGTTSATYNAILAAVGGRGTAQFGLSYDTDPEGTAQSRVTAGATVNGRSVYSIRDVDVGRDDAQLAERLRVEAKRSLLAALQASDVPQDIATIFNSITAATASEEAVDRVLAFASAVGSVNTLLGNIDQIVPDLEKLANMTIASAFQDAGDALQGLLNTYDGSIEATQELTAASAGYYNALVKLIAQIQQVQSAVDAMFGKSRESIYLTGRDDAFMKTYYKAQQDSALAMIDTLSDPTMIQKQGERLNEAIMKQWEMLSPEEQVAQRDKYMGMIDDAQTKIDNRLKELSDKAAQDAKDLLGKVHDALMTAATTMQGAADTQVNAANTQQSAANTPVQVNVDVGVTVSDDRTDATAQVTTA